LFLLPFHFKTSPNIIKIVNFFKIDFLLLLLARQTAFSVSLSEIAVSELSAWKSRASFARPEAARQRLSREWVWVGGCEESRESGEREKKRERGRDRESDREREREVVNVTTATGGCGGRPLERLKKSEGRAKR
jgi:hypothetical protein